MNSFEKNTNFVLYKECIQGQNFHIFVLEKCQYSLKNELLQIKNKTQEFQENQFLSMIFDLLDGLIQLRYYKTLHLDIKPGNILKKYDGTYVYADFDISTKCNKQKEVNKVEGYTEYFASDEQKNLHIHKFGKVTYNSDIFSLGRTFEKIIEAYEKANDISQQIKGEKQATLVKNFKEIIERFMTIKEEQNRESCENIHDKFFEKIYSADYQQFLEFYLEKIKFMSSLYEYDKNKDIPYFQNILQYYLKKRLQIINLTQKDTEDILYLRVWIADSYQQLGQYSQSFDYLQETLEIAKQDFKRNQIFIVNILESIGEQWESRGQIVKGLKYSLESLEIKKQLFQEIPLSVANCLNRIGIYYHRIYEQLNINQQTYGYINILKFLIQGKQSDTVDSQNNQINNNSDNGNERHIEKILAEQYAQESFEIRNLFKKKNQDISITTSYHNIGYLYMRAFQPKIALDYLNLSLENYKLIYKENAPVIAKVLQNIGVCYLMLHKKEEALNYFKESIKIEEEFFQETIHIKIKYLLIKIFESLYYKNKHDTLNYTLEFIRFIQDQIQINNIDDNNNKLLQSLNKMLEFFMVKIFSNNLEFINNDEEFYSKYSEDIQRIASVIFNIV